MDFRIFRSLELVLYPYLKPTASYLKDYGGGSPYIPNLFNQLSELHSIDAEGSIRSAQPLTKEVRNLIWIFFFWLT